MKQRLVKSLLISLEWRLIAFIITNLFLWFVTGTLWEATVLALWLQLILFVVHFGWYFVREQRLNSANRFHLVKDARVH